MITLVKKEIIHQIRSPIGVVSTVLFSLVLNFIFMKDVFIRGDTSIKPFFDLVPWIFLIYIPAITMRVFANEKETNSIELLLSLPISERSIVYAKAVALWIIIAIGFVLTLGVPTALIFLGNRAYFEIVSAYFGALFMGFSFVSLGMVFSLLTAHQLVSFISSCVCIFCFLLLGSDFFINIFPRDIIQFFSYMSPIYHYGNFVKGIIDIRSIIYFFSYIVLALYLCVLNLEKRT